MKLPLDKLDKLKKPHKLGIFFGVIVLFGVLFWFLIFTPAQAEIKKQEDKKIALNKKIKEHTAKVARIPEAKKRLQEIELQFQVLTKYLPQKKEVDQLLREISELGSGAGLNVVLFQPNPKDKLTDYFAEIGFKMTVEGPYLNVAQFFYETAKMDRIVNIENIKMTKPEMVDGTIILSTSCDGKTFRFLTEAEKKAREEAKAAAQKKRK